MIQIQSNIRSPLGIKNLTLQSCYNGNNLSYLSLSHQRFDNQEFDNHKFVNKYRKFEQHELTIERSPSLIPTT